MPLPVVLLGQCVLIACAGYAISSASRYARMRRGSRPVFEIERRHYNRLTFWLWTWRLLAVLSAGCIVGLTFVL